MGTVSHTRELLEELERHNANGDRSSYYSTLEQAGFRYGSVAGGVVRGDTLTGRLANAFLAETALLNGVLVGPDTAIQISEQLMQADLVARRGALRNNPNGELRFEVIAK